MYRLWERIQTRLAGEDTKRLVQEATKEAQEQQQFQPTRHIRLLGCNGSFIQHCF